jgi:CRP-like cAMP-binding protein
VIDKDVITRHVNTEAARAFNAMTLHYNLFVAGDLEKNSLLARALAEKQTRALNRTLTLLGLIQGPDDVAIVRHALRLDDARLRSRAIEYLDNLLDGEPRKRVMLLIEEMPLEERVRKGNVMYRTRARDVEDTLAQLLHDEDQAIASAAVLIVEERGLWSLAGDLEHVLAHRDVRDQDVFEAASWALAANRVHAERRKQLWQEPLPAVELADRLRHIALFDFTHIHELFRLARLGRQVRHEKGRTLYERGAVVHAVQFLLDGKVTVTGANGKDDVRAPAALGVEELLEGAPMRNAVVAADSAITLSMSADHFLALLSENVELAEGIFRMMIEAHGLGTGHTLIHGTLAPELRDKVQDDLRAIDRVLLLQSSPLLAHATAAQLWRLSAIARPVTIPSGKEAMPKGSDASILIVLSGALQVETGAGLVGTANAGDVIGMYETLAGLKLDATITAHSITHGMRLDRDALFELLADHTDLLQGVFSTILRSASAKATADQRAAALAR